MFRQIFHILSECVSEIKYEIYLVKRDRRCTREESNAAVVRRHYYLHCVTRQAVRRVTVQISRTTLGPGVFSRIVRRSGATSPRRFLDLSEITSDHGLCSERTIDR